ncbi:SDR family oxidoreductase [Aureisphaera galaxeae]|uniref:NAD(P)-dependent oxidoreductase n=1 Tax=Aureisphaera galaxeae TaxID=1538023 RepID=UPI002350C38F|nr:NAD(P)-binding oxidoreductase [Aureisphaera galaxeae]MDC8003069.1 SDR family oxidoreductase [Aureisphaera galaxeae]
MEKGKILLLGATGRTGKWVLKTALEKGYQVHCLARNSSRIPPAEGLTVFEGNASHPDAMLKAVQGCQHVISTLNVSRKSDFPWSPLKTPKDYLSNVMSLLIPMAEKQGVNRMIVCSAWGVAETKKDIPGWFRWFIDNSNIGAAYRDHERQEVIIEPSNLQWTLVRPVGLTNSTKRQSIKETFGEESKPSMTVSRKSVAEFMVDSIDRKDLIGKKVVISKG